MESKDLTIAELDARLLAAVPEGMVVIPMIRFDFEGWIALAYCLGIQSPIERQEWVMARFNELVTYIRDLRSDDTIVSSLRPDPSEAHNKV